MDLKRLTDAGFKLRNFMAAAAAMAALACAGLAQVATAQTASGDNWSLTFYGTLDVTYVGMTNGAPLNDRVPPGLDTFDYQVNHGNQSAIAGGGLTLSNIGFKGQDKLTDDLSAVFDMRSYIGTWSGQFLSGPGSVQQQNGVAANHRTGNGDSGLTGQPLAIIYAGLKSESMGTLTFGRQFTINADQTFNYDPMSRSAYLSYVGFFGGIAGGGRTEDGIMDAAAKYVTNFGNWHIGLFDQAVGAEGYGYAEQGNIGADLGNFSFDVTYSYVSDSVVAATPAAATSPVGVAAAGAVNGVVSDNESTQIGLKYKWAPTSAVYAGYEAMAFYKPALQIHGPLLTGGGIPFTPSYTNFTGANKPLLQNVWWVGAKFAATQKLDLAIAYYESDQNSYGGNTSTNKTLSGCSDHRAGTCSGTYLTQSVMADYHFDTKVDAYIGFQNDTQSGGYAAPSPGTPGVPANNNTLGMIGLRLRF